MAHTQVPSYFPQAAGLVRAVWAPIYLSPILGSPERFVIAVAVVGEQGFHVESANQLKRLECLYGSAAETALFAVEVALDELRDMLATKGEVALREGALVFSGVSIGEIIEGEARTLEDLAITWMSSISSLYRYTRNYSKDEVDVSLGDVARGDRLPELVLAHVASSKPKLLDFFSRDIINSRKRRESSKVASVSIDFSGNYFVANFSTFSVANQAGTIDRIKRKMFDIKVKQDQERSGLFGARQHEMIIFTPHRDSPLLSGRQLERLGEALDLLGEQSGREGFGFRAFDDVPDIGQRVLEMESPVRGTA